MSVSWHKSFIITLILVTITNGLQQPDSYDDQTGVKSRAPRLFPHPRNITALERTTAILICEADGEPKPSFTWSKNYQPLAKRRLPVIKYSRGTLLRIDNLKNDRDSGTYECLVENGIGTSIRVSMYVKIINDTEAPVGFPKISGNIRQITVEAGGIATIPCNAHGDPAPEYHWLHDAVPIQIPDPGNNTKYIYDNGNLQITNVTESDKGEYLCIASNLKGFTTSHPITLSVSTEPLPEGEPIDLKYKLTSPEHVTISWSPPKSQSNISIIGYEVNLGKVGASTSVKKELPNVNSTAFNELSENTEYAFRVRGKSKGGFGKWTDAISFWTPKDVPQPPANVKALADTFTSAMIWWDETPYFDHVIGYRVYYNLTTFNSELDDDYDNWMVKNITLTNSTMITNLVDHSYYVVRVCAVGLTFSGKLSNIIRFKSEPEEVPYDLSVHSVTTQSAILVWKQPTEMISPRYKIVYDAPEQSFIDDHGKRRIKSFSPKVIYSNDTKVSINQDLIPYTRYRVNVTAISSSKDSFRPPGTLQFTTLTAAPKEMNEPTLIGVPNNSRGFEISLPWASEEYGPIGHYYVIVVPSDGVLPDPDMYPLSDLKRHDHNSPNGSDLPYISAKFSKSKMVETFVLGDNKMYDGFLNRELNKDKQYQVFVRAVLENSDLNKSSPYSAIISLSQRSEPFKEVPAYISDKTVRTILLVALCMTLVLGFIGTMFWRKQRQTLKSNQMNETTIRLLPDPSIYSTLPVMTNHHHHLHNGVGNGDRANMTYASRAMLNHPPIPVNQLADHIDFLKMNDNLKEEYESIEPGQPFTWQNSYLECNLTKNRYNNVNAYDQTRVKLAPIEGKPGSDYINANYCDGYLKPNHYIATQGPLPNTAGDFWRMVWEQKSKTIVMMTQLEERGRVKCFQYWPSQNSIHYDGITITALEVEDLAYYSIRKFRLQCGQLSRDVSQFQFTAWPDHGVPDHPTPFLMFLRRIKISNPSDAGPMIVLCSAGVGRTGCFIVIDSMIERIKQENNVDIYGHVTSLRAQRIFIVQTQDQYMFIHDAVLEAVLSSDTEIPFSRLSEHLHKLMQVLPSSGQTGLELEFKRLAMIKFSGQKFISANLPFNKSKNRLMNILPYESTRVCLEPIPGIEGSDYINASFCDGYRQRNAYIATQSPLRETVEDFWRMIIEHDSRMIVMLTQLNESGREICAQYWPSQGSVDFGPYRVTLNQNFDRTNSTLEYELREFIVTDLRHPDAMNIDPRNPDPPYSRKVRQFHYVDWPEQGVPKAGDSFINFIVDFHKTKQNLGVEGPITVMCSVGVGRTGAFIASSIIMERLLNERFLNLFETVRTLRTQRPAMVQTEDQYQFCYQTALLYSKMFE